MIPSDAVCRYCLEHISAEDNVSCCFCLSPLCADCLRKELGLTGARNDRSFKCTVCNYHYSVRRVVNFVDILEFIVEVVLPCANRKKNGCVVFSLVQLLLNYRHLDHYYRYGIFNSPGPVASTPMAV